MIYICISLLVARQRDVSRQLNQAFLLVDSFSSNCVDEERSDIYMNNFVFSRICDSLKLF